MKLQKIYLLILFFCNPFFVTAQVNLQTGAATYSMPIFSYSDQSRLSTAISLGYIAGSGLKVNEVSSEVGTGWSLQAGGVISRVQRGLPDDQRRSLSIPNPLPQFIQMKRKEYYTKYYPHGYLFSNYSPDDIITNRWGWIEMLPPSTTCGYDEWYTWIVQEEKIAADREQDIFRLDYGKGAVEFIINKNLEVVVLNDKKIKVQIFFEDMTAMLVNTCISKFIVTDTDGIQYIFSEKELSENIRYDNLRVPFTTAGYYPSLPEPNPNNYTFGQINLDDNCGLNRIVSGNANGQQYIFSTANIGRKTGNYTVTKWYLSSIFNPQVNTKAINFTYEHYDIDMQTTRLLQAVSSTYSTTISREVIKALRIKSINALNSTIDFIYENAPRADIPTQKPIKEIVIKKNNVIINKFIFQYQYFFTSLLKPYGYQFPENHKFLARLCLKSVQKVGGNNVIMEPPYNFDYYLGNPAHAYYPSNTMEYSAGTSFDIVPPMFSNFTDHWGYYNGLIDRGYDGQWETPANLVLYKFKSVASKEPSIGLAKNGILKEIRDPFGGSSTFEYEQNSANFNGQNISVGGVRVKKTIEYDGINHSNDLIKQYSYTKADNISSSGWGYEIPTYSLAKGKRVYKVYNNYNNKPARPQESIASVGMSAITKTISYYKVTDKILGNAIHAFGPWAILFKEILNTIINVSLETFIQIFVSMPDVYQESTDIVTQNFSFQSNNPLPQSYSRVEESSLYNGNLKNGKTVYEFLSDLDKPLPVPVLTAPFSNQTRFYKSYYGLPKKVSIFDNTGFLIKETLNEYELKSHYVGNSKAYLSIIDIYDQRNQSGHYAYIDGSGNVSSMSYSALAEHTEMKYTKEKVYSKNSPGFVENRIDYTYNTYNNQISTQKTTNSKGKIIETRMYYPQDYNLATITILQTMVNKNIINTPISTEIWQTNSNGVSEMLSASVAAFGVAANGDYMPIKNYKLQTDKPVPISIIGAFNPSVLVRNSNFIKAETEITYSNTGNMVELKDLEAAKQNCTIYSNNIVDFNSNTTEYPIATITNAALSEVAYSSFEYDPPAGASNGIFLDNNWTITNATWAEEISPTGKRNIGLNPTTTISTNVNITKDYKLTFWATSNSVNVNLFVPTIIGPTVNGWTYFEYNIPSGSATPMITGNCKIDELRLYPKSSNITTTTYSTGIGKTSECDINNRIIYYEYDALGRITLVKDESRNVIKTYQYNYKN